MFVSKKNFAVIFTLFVQVSLNAQIANGSTEVPLSLTDTVPANLNKTAVAVKNKFPVKSLIIPAALVSYGAVTMNSHGANSTNGKLQEKIWIDKPHSTNGVDNFLMFSPAVAVYALNAFGVKGKNNFRDRTMIYLLSNIFATAIVYPTKTFTKQTRPNGAKYSFPSGHTATAFASAEFMRMEYKERSAWYGVAGYAMAAATGYLRMYNNKHWFSDVVAGAGIGIASTQLSYWLYPKIKKTFFKDKTSNTMIMPSYQQGALGLGLVHRF